MIHIRPGVLWVSCAGHGGLLVGRGVATERLSDVALAVGARFGQYLAYEEDVDCCAVFAERPDWYRRLMSNQGTSCARPDGELVASMREQIVQYHDLETLKSRGAAVRAELELGRGLGVGDCVTLRPDYTLSGAPVGELTICQVKPLMGRTTGGMRVHIPRTGIASVTRTPGARGRAR